MSKEIKKIEDCTEKQIAFLQALKDPGIIEVGQRERMRWAATVAGYSENTTISEIMAPLRHLIKDVVEQGFIEASIHAMWQVMDPVTGGTVDAHTKTRIDAAREILDRSVPKKTETKGVSGATTVVVIPAKTPTAEVVNKLIEHDPNEEISTP